MDGQLEGHSVTAEIEYRPGQIVTVVLTSGRMEAEIVRARASERTVRIRVLRTDERRSIARWRIVGSGEPRPFALAGALPHRVRRRLEGPAGLPIGAPIGRARDAMFLEFVRSQPCSALGCAHPGPSEVEIPKLAGDEYLALPLCREHRADWHDGLLPVSRAAAPKIQRDLLIAFLRREYGT